MGLCIVCFIHVNPPESFILNLWAHGANLARYCIKGVLAHVGIMYVYNLVPICFILLRSCPLCEVLAVVMLSQTSLENIPALPRGCIPCRLPPALFSPSCPFSFLAALQL